VSPNKGILVVLERGKTPVSGRDRGLCVSLYYGVYVIVIVCVLCSQPTVAPRFSVTNLNGSIVLPLMISGTTFAFVESIGVLTPFTLAALLPIQRAIVFFPSVTVAFLAVPSQPTVPPSASMIARIGTRKYGSSMNQQDPIPTICVHLFQRMNSKFMR